MSHTEPVAARLRSDHELAHESAVLAEHLNAIVGAVAHVHETVERRLRAVHGASELLRRRSSGIVWPEVRIVGHVAVRAPITLARAGVHVEHDHSLVAVTVGHERLVRGRVYRDLCDAPEIHGIVAALVHLRLAELQQELPGAGKLQDVRVGHIVAADPDVVHVVDGDAVIRRGPVVAVARTAPRAHEIARGVELEHRRRNGAALAGGVFLPALASVSAFSVWWR